MFWHYCLLSRSRNLVHTARKIPFMYSFSGNCGPQSQFTKFGAIPGTLFIYFVFFLHTLIQYSSSGWSSPAGYLPVLGINSCVWVNNSSCWAEGGVPGGCQPVSIYTFMCLWEIYIFPGLVHIFPCSRIGRPILEIYKSLTDLWV